MALVADIYRRGTRALQPLATSVPEGVVYYVTDEGKTERSNGSTWDDVTDSGGTAPSGADYLVGTSNGGLSAEIVVGTTPGGELGGTWDSPTIDTTHSGSSHSSVPYTPTDNDDWNSATDPGAAQDGLDQLAARVAVLERTQEPDRALTDELFVSSGLTLTESGSGETIDVITLGVDTAVLVTVSNTNFVDLTDGGDTTLHTHSGTTNVTDQALYDAHSTATTIGDEVFATNDTIIATENLEGYSISLEVAPQLLLGDAAATTSTEWDKSWEWCHRGQYTVTAADTTNTITHGFNDTGAIIPTPGVTWNTTVYISAQTATSVTFTYGTPCPAGGGTLHWTAMI